MTATDEARVDHRCKPGRKTVDRRCTWHPTHHWCEACAGWYGVPHDVYSCHTTQQGIRKVAVRGDPADARSMRLPVLHRPGGESRRAPRYPTNRQRQRGRGGRMNVEQPEINRPEQWRHKHRCIRCQQLFSIGSVERCPTVPDGGEHESPHLHWFKPGRLDGLCAETDQLGLMCGYAERDDFIHVG